MYFERGKNNIMHSEFVKKREGEDRVKKSGERGRRFILVKFIEMKLPREC